MKTHDGSDILWTAADAAAATNGRHPTGRTPGHWMATGVSIDSRTLRPGDLFVALKGPNFDGHDYVGDALAHGAAAALVSRLPGNVPPEAPVLLVDDTLAALEDLGRVARLNARGKVIAVTGSVGKTGTKEALKLCLDARGPTFATQGSLNNHWGVPLSLARFPADAHYGVFELGMNHAGEIGPLSRMVQPDVAIITTVEAVHLEFFASVEGIADAKAEIFEGMTPAGTAILNRDNPHFARLVAAARTQGLTRIWSFGTQEGADAHLLECSLHATSSAVTASIRGERIQYCLSLPGRHHVLNSLAVLLAVSAAEGDVAAAARQLSQIAPIKGRGLRRRVALAKGSFTVIDESYNASPVSVAAAATVLGKADPGAGGRRIAVLGDMLELGAQAPSLHAGLADQFRRAGADLVFCCGPNMKFLFDRLPAALRGRHTEDSAALAPLVADAVRAGDVVMVKGSAGSRMSRVVDALVALDHGDQAAEAPAAVAAGSAS
ncbi:UDP-N-acetylmuramoylalanyl-D-glutamyl-2,6-diaminopimelate--D-alanyl-D-alanine ligase [Rhodospirillum centenum]|uniref:UDP-N-acetylmuramoyl-tripeptide--D-alanyl-D-alanine ligase n=1 Tax=Rhodospirillum centenum (strain ATCC 51521 / SW) TaxID=414684 RepID=B6IRG6_RHOCS|nr:UDP-N-acetylmuramoylalanyl-D-glutamyl-2,6-diaminopimelate--D-alanyl-D-alanine ligase [Rhodospirillum centenum]ACI98052.1 UDP-N-acetylmuramoylalanyl-D-glutamyl-2, 6-diaminopimelate--D-alanyl-D-alanyl ligase [Rhodospirillum centenum SW]